MDWRLTPLQRELLAFTRAVFAIRAANPVLRRRNYFRHEPDHPGGAKDLTWLRPDGSEMTEADWADPSNHVLGMLILGEATDEVDERGRRLRGEAILLLTNGGARSRPFTLPLMETPGGWTEILNTAHPVPRVVRQGKVSVVAHSLMLLRTSGRGDRVPRSARPTGSSSMPVSPSPRPASSSPT